MLNVKIIMKTGQIYDIGGIEGFEDFRNFSNILFSQAYAVFSSLTINVSDISSVEEIKSE